ncbi:DNA-binding protein [Rhizobium ruizarguesonis]|uniref:helix-turn-helix domain-containing protein n=1 Tax=Rhizobium ruizarguesonis TaxID=2081791 RepID=UPI001030065A|nr:helix-turn-helix domain-containing protein [Rhizobium ruizarguesonis]TBB67723.1 DNA-binding protein [Rhizobium ruizarguesonis]
MTENLLTLAEVAATLKVSTRHLRDLATAGQIAFINVGSQKRYIMRFHPDDVAEFIRSRRVRLGRPSAARTGHQAQSNVDFMEILRLEKIRRAKK